MKYKNSQTEYDKKVTVNSRYNEPRHFYLINNDWFYDVCGDIAVGMSCVSDGSLGHVDPSGGPFVGVDTNLSGIHKDLPNAYVTKIEYDTDRGLFKLSVSNISLHLADLCI